MTVSSGNRQFGTFVLVGIVCAICDVGVMHLLNLSGLNYLVSAIVGFQIVKTLSAQIGLGPFRVKFPETSNLQFRRTWNEAALCWRCDCLANKVAARAESNITKLAAPALFGGLVNAFASLDQVSISKDNDALRCTPFNLFIGSIPAAWQRFSIYMNIPGFLRPSPLNLIYRSLLGRVERLDPDGVFHSFVDFDVY